MKSVDELPASDQRLHDLLVNSSRTFALAIPQLPPRLQREVTVAYLLFRIADTLEDAGDSWSKKRQLSSLGEFERLLREPQSAEPEDLVAGWLQEPPTEH
ncbi:MAG: squalene/phytoene synthase family protein, partial [Deltaproteobacteria bacterium]|nr:squalene/phytoene synthase family protein [Deltaproteobacteria bacterium]